MNSINQWQFRYVSSEILCDYSFYPQNCMDVLAFETSAYASIMKPVALQLINQHYSESDESIETDIAVLEKDLKETIVKVFQQQ